MSVLTFVNVRDGISIQSLSFLISFSTRYLFYSKKLSGIRLRMPLL